MPPGVSAVMPGVSNIWNNQDDRTLAIEDNANASGLHARARVALTDDLHSGYRAALVLSG